MNPYKIDINELIDSEDISDEKIIIKYKLFAEFLKLSRKLSSDEVIELTGLNKSDLSRIRALNLDRYSIGKAVDLLESLGYSTKIKVVKSA